MGSKDSFFTYQISIYSNTVKTKRKELDRIELKILRLIARTGECRFSANDIAMTVATSQSKADRTIKKLTREGYVRILRKGKPNIIQVVLENPKVTNSLKAISHFSTSSRTSQKRIVSEVHPAVRVYQEHMSTRNQTCNPKVTNSFNKISHFCPTDQYEIQEPKFIGNVRTMFGKPPVVVQRISIEEFESTLKEATRILLSDAFSKDQKVILDLIADFKKLCKETYDTKEIQDLDMNSKMYRIYLAIITASCPGNAIESIKALITEVKVAKHKWTFRSFDRIKKMSAATKAVYEILVNQGSKEEAEEILWEGTGHLEEMKRTRQRLRDERYQRDPELAYHEEQVELWKHHEEWLREESNNLYE